ncbi:hypothetical protein LTS10_010221 [Elasticomyces elasticus]|nr:hypothetical protein LTS10_010221 [Elasticomyces elasticus]
MSRVVRDLNASKRLPEPRYCAGETLKAKSKDPSAPGKVEVTVSRTPAEYRNGEWCYEVQVKRGKREWIRERELSFE